VDVDGVGETAKQPFRTGVPSLVDSVGKGHGLALWLLRNHRHLTG
jgi:hypothetical protein